jgi:hypothetical protein
MTQLFKVTFVAFPATFVEASLSLVGSASCCSFRLRDDSKGSLFLKKKYPTL